MQCYYIYAVVYATYAWVWLRWQHSALGSVQGREAQLFALLELLLLMLLLLMLLLQHIYDVQFHSEHVCHVRMHMHNTHNNGNSVAVKRAHANFHTKRGKRISCVGGGDPLGVSCTASANACVYCSVAISATVDQCVVSLSHFCGPMLRCALSYAPCSDCPVSDNDGLMLKKLIEELKASVNSETGQTLYMKRCVTADLQ